MKNLIVTIFFWGFALGCYSVQTTNASVAIDQGMDLSKYITKDDFSSKFTSMQKDLTKSIADSLKNYQTSGCFGQENIKWQTWLLIFLPVILFFFVTWFVTKRLAVGFNVTESLKENIPIMKTELNPIYSAVNLASLQALTKDAATAAASSAGLTATIQTSTNQNASSSSRYMAMLTVFFGLAIISCFISAYIYSYIECPSKPIDLNYLKDVFVALLVGIAPYGFNRLGSGLQGKQ